MQTIKKKLTLLNVVVPILLVVVIIMEYQVREAQADFKAVQKERTNIGDQRFKSLFHNDSIQSNKIDSLNCKIESWKNR